MSDFAMNKRQYLDFLQQVLTLVDINNSESVEKAKRIINDVCELKLQAGGYDRFTLQIMRESTRKIDLLLMHRDDFMVGSDRDSTLHNRRRLELVLRPHC